jgi:hypothetical protein
MLRLLATFVPARFIRVWRAHDMVSQLQAQQAGGAVDTVKKCASRAACAIGYRVAAKAGAIVAQTTQSASDANLEWQRIRMRALTFCVLLEGEGCILHCACLHVDTE